MKNFEFKPVNKIVFVQSETSSPVKTRDLVPDMSCVLAGLENKQQTDFPLRNFDNLFVVGKVNLNIATDVKGIVMRYAPILNEKNEMIGVKPNFKKSWKIVPTVQEINGKETVGYKFRLLNPTDNQKEAIEKVTELAPLSLDMLG